MLVRTTTLLFATMLLSTAVIGAAHAEGVTDKDDPGWEFWDHWTFLPIIYFTPETSLGLGAAVVHTFDLPGDDPNPSTVQAGAVYTLKEQILTKLAGEFRYDDRLIASGLVRYIRYPNTFFGIGNDPDATGEDYQERIVPIELEGTYRVLGELRLGGHYWLRYHDVYEYQGGGRLASGEVLGVTPFIISGIGPTLTIDTRDVALNPSSGWHHQFRLTLFGDLFGSDHTFVRATLDLRGYFNIVASHVVAVRMIFDMSSGDVPFQALPRLGGDQLMRGFFEGRLRDKQLMALEAEYRMPLWWRFGLAGFVSVGQVMGGLDRASLGRTRVSGGAGLRFLLNTTQQVRLRVDVALGDDLQFYVQVFEPF